MSGGNAKTPSSTTHTNLILVGEAFTVSAKLNTPDDVDHMLAAARIRFATNGMWSINASDAEKITPPVRAQLTRVFKIFKEAGGIKIIVVSAKPFVATQFLGAAREAGIELQVIAKSEEYASIAKAFRDKYHPKPSGPSK